MMTERAAAIRLDQLRLTLGAMSFDFDCRFEAGAITAVVGPSGSGKSTIANMVEKKLHALGKHTFLLDGDNVRHGLNKDLGFTEADRIETLQALLD